jgi:hypothetical protein
MKRIICTLISLCVIAVIMPACSLVRLTGQLASATGTVLVKSANDEEAKDKKEEEAKNKKEKASEKTSEKAVEKTSEKTPASETLPTKTSEAKNDKSQNETSKMAGDFCKAKKNCYVRPEPSTKEAPIAKLQAADVIEKVGQQGNWIKIRLDDGSEGWVYKTMLEMQ